MRQVGDRLIPVGVTSGRIHALNPEDVGAEVAEGGGSRRRRRNGGNAQLEQYMSIPGQDLEEVKFLQIHKHISCSLLPLAYAYGSDASVTYRTRRAPTKGGGREAETGSGRSGGQPQSKQLKP